MDKFKAGVIGATGMVGQRFVTLISRHPWFELSVVAASARSAGRTYEEAAGSRWALDEPMPECAKQLVLRDASDVESVAADVARWRRNTPGTRSPLSPTTAPTAGRRTCR